MNLRSKLSARIMLMLSFAVPAAFVSLLGNSATPAKAQVIPSSVVQKSSPFIQPNSRHDTLGTLNKVPIGGILSGKDGGTGKETSDTGKEACDKCKETCESGNCGGFQDRFDPVVLPAGDKLINPAQIQQKGLIKSVKPIF